MSSHSTAQRLFVARIILALLVFFISLLFSDFILKMFLHIPSYITKGIIRYDPSLLPHHRLKSNLNLVLVGAFSEFKFRLTTNEEGFRNTDPPKRESESYRIVFLGDSQTAGTGMDDKNTFPSYVSRILNVPVLNTGCYGYSNVEELQIAQLLLKKYTPKLVILCFFAGNDPFENFKRRIFLEGNEGADRPTPANHLTFNYFKETLKQNSSIYNLIIMLRKFDTVNNLFYKLNLTDNNPPLELLVYKTGDIEKKKRFWDLTQKTLLRIRDELQNRGIEFLVVNIPDKCYIDDAYWAGWLKKYRLKADDYDLLEPARHLMNFCDKNQMNCLDLNQTLKSEQNKGRPMYWRMDHHLAVEGNRVIGESIANYLKTKSQAFKDLSKLSSDLS